MTGARPSVEFRCKWSSSWKSRWVLPGSLQGRVFWRRSPLQLRLLGLGCSLQEGSSQVRALQQDKQPALVSRGSF